MIIESEPLVRGLNELLNRGVFQFVKNCNKIELKWNES